MDQPSSLNRNVQVYSADHIDGQPRYAVLLYWLMLLQLHAWENLLGGFEAVEMKVLSHMLLRLNGMDLAVLLLLSLLHTVTPPDTAS